MQSRFPNNVQDGHNNHQYRGLNIVSLYGFCYSLGMDSTADRTALIEELKRYLLFLKDAGFDAIPLQSRLAPSFPPPSPPPPATGHPPMASSRRQTPGPAQETLFPQTPVSPGAKGLEEIREAMGECTRCKLSQGRRNIVFGSGNPEADLMFIGEGPGADEDAQGLPFVGRAGQKLTDIIEKGMRLNRERDTYICNIVKCRPPNNRDPEAEEIAACKPFLLQQIQAVRPKVIVALGKPAASTLLGRPVAITRERGTWHEFMGIPLMLTFHPAYLLRAYTLENRRAVQEDMNQVLEKLGP